MRRCSKVVAVASTDGSVLNETLKNTFFKGLVHSVVCDRPCGAADKARAHGVRTETFSGLTNDQFCDRLLEYLDEHEIDYVISFYTQFYASRIRAAYTDRIVNLHPSLLPSFKGMDGFGDAIRYGVTFTGSTVELIYNAMDEGKIIHQTMLPVSPTDTDEVRHRLFVQQCKSLLQVVRWLVDGRVRVDDRRVFVTEAQYLPGEFSPNLDFEDAIQLMVEPPPWLDRQ